MRGTTEWTLITLEGRTDSNCTDRLGVKAALIPHVAYQQDLQTFRFYRMTTGDTAAWYNAQTTTEQMSLLE